nr:Chain L, GRP [Homo sapiens]
NHWAVGHLM